MSLLIHCGAGSYSNPTRDEKYLSLLDIALEKGLELLNENCTSTLVAAEVTKILEESPLTNAAHGSNLTRKGIVECDASIAWIEPNKHLGNFASMGAVYGLDSPVLAALKLSSFQDNPSSSKTLFLAGKEAWAWGMNNDLSNIRNDSELLKFQVTDRALSEWNNAVMNFPIEDADSKRVKLHDTVGCLCIDKTGRISAACSSGGPLFRVNGRVGPAALRISRKVFASALAC